jgi:[ribosomal protein S5]-alanine N-acetyltransferase
MAPGWPTSLREGPVVLRPLRRNDARAWFEVRQRNLAWLEPWEATSPEGEHRGTPTFAQYVRMLSRQGRRGEALPFAVEYHGAFVGQLTVSSVVRGSARSASIGYWIDRDVAGRGIIPTAVAMAVDHCFGPVGLHRIEITIRPENAASLRVVAKLGLREEGLRERFLHIQGEWRDHRTFAITSDEVPDGLVSRWRRIGGRAARHAESGPDAG